MLLRGTHPLDRSCPFCTNQFGRSIWREDGYSYARCASCRGVFADIEQSDYGRGRHNVWDEDAADPDVLGFYGDARRAAHTAFLDRLPPWGTRRLLDVGCGLGFFLERARSHGWSVHGCEPAPSWAALAEERLGEGHVTRGGVEELPPSAVGFDLITAWDVIEHVFDPVPFLAAIARRLAPGGRVFIRTPNFDYVLPVYRLRRRAGHPVTLGPLNHVVYFTTRSMRRALMTAGLEPTEWLSLPPPQVATFETVPSRRYAPRRSTVLAAKNAWSRGAGMLVRATGGRLVPTADLDVLVSRL